MNCDSQFDLVFMHMYIKDELRQNTHIKKFVRGSGEFCRVVASIMVASRMVVHRVEAVKVLAGRVVAP